MKMAGQTINREAVDGKSVKQTGMMGNKTQEGEELASNLAKAMFAYEVNPAAAGLTATVQGVEPVEGKDAYKVELKHTNGAKWTEYYDAQTGFKVRDVTMQKGPDGTEAAIQVDYAEYKPLASTGVLVAGKRKVTVGPQAMTFELQKAEANTKLKDDIFSAQ